MIKKNMRPGFNKKGPNAIWLLLFIVSIGMAYLFWYNSLNRDIDSIAYSKLVLAIENDEVRSIYVQGQHVQGKYKNGKAFDTYIIPTIKFWDLLKEHNVDTEVFPIEKDSWGNYLFVGLFFAIVLLFFFYMRQMQNGGNGGSGKIFSVGKSKAKFFSPNTITVTFKDVAGNDAAKDDLKDIIDFLKNSDKYEKIGAKIPRGILLTGAPGNGKTLLAKAVAGEASVSFFSISGSDFVEVFVGVGASRVRDLFAQARKNSPCILFIDEIDAVGRQRGVGLGGGNDEREQTLNQMLAEMDGFSTEHGAVIVLAATNRPDVLDKALLRPGRFDRIIEVPYPDLVSREAILAVHTKTVKLDESINLNKIARGTAGFSGADLSNLINEAALIATKKNKESISMHEFELARDKITLGSEHKTIILTEKDKLKTSFHEAGHTLLNILLDNVDPLHKVTIIPRGRTLGVSWSLPVRDKYSITKEELEARMIICFGGLIAEKLRFQTQTTGCSNDFVQATEIARKMVRCYGMSDLGPIDLNLYQGKETYEISEHMAKKIDDAVDKIIQATYKRGEILLLDNQDKLELLATTLLEKETMQAKEVYDLLGLEHKENHSLHE